MKLLGLDAVNLLVTSTGVSVARHESATGFYYDLQLSGTSQQFEAERPERGERAFDLLSLLMNDVACGRADFWVLWLHGRVYTTDEFTLALLRVLSQARGAGPGGTWDGYRFEAEEVQRCALIATIVVMAEWDLFLVPSHGRALVSFEHDGRVVYERSCEPEEQSSDWSARIVSRFGFGLCTGRRPGKGDTRQ